MRLLFGICRWLLVASTGRGYDRSDRINNLHHKFAYRLHKLLPKFGIVGLQRVAPTALNGKHLYVRAEDGGVGHQFIVYQDYEPFETQLVRQHLKPGMTVYNIGANVGYYVLLASECVGAEGRVVAFEPAPANLELLRRSITENRIGNVTIVGCAVGAADGTARLALSPTNSGDHQLRADSARDHVTVEVRSVDSLIESGLPAPDAIIMDVQGSELDVVRGMTKLLAMGRPNLMLSEFWPEGLDARHKSGAEEFLHTLQAAGFSICIIDAKRKRLTPQPPLPAGRRGFASEVNLLCLRDLS